MRVLVLTAAYPSATEPTRGVFIENLHRAMLATTGGDLEITTVAPRTHEADAPEETRHGVRVVRFASGTGGLRLKDARLAPWRLAAYALAARRTLAREARRGSPDALVAHWLLPSGLIASRVARRHGLPLVSWAHGSDVHRYARGRVGAAMVRRCLRGSRRVLAVSRELADRLREIGGAPGGRVDVLPMGAAPEFRPGDREAARRALGLEDDGVLDLLWIGDVAASKGIATLVEGARLAREGGVDLRLTLLGEVTARSGLPPDVSRPDWLRVLGVRPQSEVAERCRAADLLVHASPAEGSPLAVLEALATGLPVVATRVGGVPDLVEDGVSGLLVSPGRPRELADAIARLGGDADARGAMRRALAADASAGRHLATARAPAVLECLEEVIRGAS